MSAARDRRATHLDTLERLGLSPRVSSNGSEANFRCPFPEHNDAHPSFGFNLDTGLWSCHGCGRSGRGMGTLHFQLTGRRLREYRDLDGVLASSALTIHEDARNTVLALYCRLNRGVRRGAISPETVARVDRLFCRATMAGRNVALDSVDSVIRGVYNTHRRT